MILDISLHKKVIVFGLGVSARGVIRLLNKLSIDVVAVNGTDHEQTKRILHDHDLAAISILKDDEVMNFADIDASCVVLSPGIPRDHKFLKGCSLPIISEIEFAYQFIKDDMKSHSKIIALTGTNGKTTTVSFLDTCFEKSQLKHFTGGNIGTPLVDYAYSRIVEKIEPVDVILLELSSFQLESMIDFTADIAIINNLTFSHGERYENLSDYGAAKFHIFDRQSPMQIRMTSRDVLESAKIHGLDSTGEGKLHILEYEKASEVMDKFHDYIHVYGKHNDQNLYLSKMVLDQLSISDNIFIEALESFKGVEFRLQKIYEDNDLLIFNDAKSTNWDATTIAVQALQGLGKISLVVGGQLRGEGDYQRDKLIEISHCINELILTGESGKVIKENLDRDGLEVSYRYLETLEEIKETLSNMKGVLLYSPAFPSFDQFKNYVERGKRFSELFIDL